MPGVKAGRFGVGGTLSANVALEAAADLAVASAFGASAGDVGAGGGVVAHAAADGDVEGTVQLAIT
jgi:hypothetical protein